MWVYLDETIWWSTWFFPLRRHQILVIGLRCISILTWLDISFDSIIFQELIAFIPSHWAYFFLTRSFLLLFTSPGVLHFLKFQLSLLTWALLGPRHPIRAVLSLISFIAFLVDEINVNDRNVDAPAAAEYFDALLYDLLRPLWHSFYTQWSITESVLTFNHIKWLLLVLNIFLNFKFSTTCLVLLT